MMFGFITVIVIHALVQKGLISLKLYIVALMLSEQVKHDRRIVFIILVAINLLSP